MQKEQIHNEVIKALVFYTNQPAEDFNRPLSIEDFLKLPWVSLISGGIRISSNRIAMYLIQTYHILNRRTENRSPYC